MAGVSYKELQIGEEGICLHGGGMSLNENLAIGGTHCEESEALAGHTVNGPHRPTDILDNLTRS